MRSARRRLGLAAAVAAAALVLVPAAGSLPREGVLDPGRSLGGVRLGATAAQLQAAWGTRYGVCRGCRQTTWYFNERRFEPQGAGAELRGGVVVALFTLWKPDGWRTRGGLRLGETAARVTEVFGPLTRQECGGYYALVLPADRATTAFYVRGDELFAFGLLQPGVPVCR